MRTDDIAPANRPSLTNPVPIVRPDMHKELTDSEYRALADMLYQGIIAMLRQMFTTRQLDGNMVATINQFYELRTRIISQIDLPDDHY